MKWGTFGIVHILSLFIGAGIIVGLYFILKNKTTKTQTITLGILSFAGVAAIIFNLFMWKSPLEYLPFHLCSLTAMVLPIAVLTKNKELGNLLCLWSLGALAALVVNNAQADYKIFSWTFVFYYFPHVLEFGIPILLILFKHIKLDPKCIISTLVITLVSYTVIHFINVGLNNHFESIGSDIRVNYMYSITPSIPLLQVFYNIIPSPYWYMLLVFPVVAIYLGALYYGYHLYTKSKEKTHQGN